MGGQSLSGGYLNCITVAVGDSNRIYTGASDGQIWMTRDAGAMWKQINAGLPNRAVTSVATFPGNPSAVLVSLSGTTANTPRLWVCNDTTAAAPQWVNISGAGATGLPDVPANCVVLDPYQPASVYYVGTDIGAFFTQNSGATWTNATQPLGLPNVAVYQLVVVPGTRYLHAVTYGRGIWRINLAPPRAVSGIITLDGVPNPASVNAAAPVGPITLEFRPTNGGATLVRSAALPANGAFSFGDIPAGSYSLAVKGAKWLRVAKPIDATGSNVTNLQFFLPTGDANNDNACDVVDFGILVNAYGSKFNDGTGNYDPTADFNCDGRVDVLDFGLLVNNYGALGDN